MAAYTASFQSSKKVNQSHNRRDRGTVERQNARDTRMGFDPHIDPHGRFIPLRDMSEIEALHALLDESIREYNCGKKPSRQTTFEKEVKKIFDKSKTITREVIITYGNARERPPVEVCIRMLKKSFQRFQQQNPNLFITGAYIHADEPSAAPHLHIDYIPWHKKRSRGIGVQIGMTGALEDMGYENNGFSTKEDRKMGAMAQWDDIGHAMTKLILAEAGFEVKEGEKSLSADSGDRHRETEEYKEEQRELEMIREERTAEAAELTKAIAEREALSGEILELQTAKDLAERRVRDLQTVLKNNGDHMQAQDAKIADFDRLLESKKAELAGQTAKLEEIEARITERQGFFESLCGRTMTRWLAAYKTISDVMKNYDTETQIEAVADIVDPAVETVRAGVRAVHEIGRGIREDMELEQMKQETARGVADLERQTEDLQARAAELAERAPSHDEDEEEDEEYER